MPKKSLSLLKGLLRLEPSERLTAEEALRHPFFDGLNSNIPEPVMSKRNLTANKNAKEKKAQQTEMRKTK